MAKGSRYEWIFLLGQPTSTMVQTLSVEVIEDALVLGEQCMIVVLCEF